MDYPLDAVDQVQLQVSTALQIYSIIVETKRGPTQEGPISGKITSVVGSVESASPCWAMIKQRHQIRRNKYECSSAAVHVQSTHKSHKSRHNMTYI